MFTLLRRADHFIQRVLRRSEAHQMLLYATAVGVLGALATVVFRDSLALVQHVLVGQSGWLEDMTLPWQTRILLPTFGGIVAGCLLVLAKRVATGVTSEYMEAVAVGDGDVSVKQTILRSLSSFCSIVSGGSIGREGAMVQLAAMCASAFGRTIKFESSRLRLLVACGAAAGLAAAYNAPIAGAFFVSEIVLGSIAMYSFGPVRSVSSILSKCFP